VPGPLLSSERVVDLVGEPAFGELLGLDPDEQRRRRDEIAVE
jgi:hypothetical protein